MSINVFFTGAVDHRFAWIGNDASGSDDILARLQTLIGTATASIAVSSMTFNYNTDSSDPGWTAADQKIEAIADLLATKAQSGLPVRLVGNAGHRYQAGYFRALRGPVHIADNNLPALVCRISFQRAGTPPPEGFLIDSGAVYGLRSSGLYYGWNSDVTVKIDAHGAVPAGFTSPLLGECYANNNANGPRTWSIQLPAGHYYVHVVTGEAAYASKSFVVAQGSTWIFLRKNSGGHYQYFENTNTGAGEFACSTVDGGTDASDTGLPMAKRLGVISGGTLDLTIGKSGESSYSSVNYIEIYKASDIYPNGDPGLDKSCVQERSLHHTKFVLIDAGTPGARLWTGSHNLTPVDPSASDVRSEDAILTDEAAICAAFATEFNQWWGGPGGSPDPAASRTGMFKVPVNADGSVSSSLPGVTVNWRVRFSPSVNTAPGLDMYQTVADFLNSGSEEALLLVEQITDSGSFTGPYGTYPGSTSLINLLRNMALAGKTVHGLVGNTDPTDSIFTSLSGTGTAAVASSTRIHDKCVCLDTLRDNPSRLRGKVLCGSMNWSQSALHVNNEQTLIIEDPALANQYLQRAASAFSGAGIALARTADCIIVLDRSYSMNQAASAASTKLQAAQLAAKVFVDLLDQSGSLRVSLVRFGASVEPFVPAITLAPLTSGAAISLKTQIDGIVADLPIGNWTCYGLALQEAFSQLTGAVSPNPRQLIVFLSDGLENQAPWSSSVYPGIAAQGIEIHTTSFGIGGISADAILSTMATVSGGSFAHVDDDAVTLQKRFADVARDAQNMITILDPTWTLKSGAQLSQRFPVDMAAGTLLVVLLWGGQTGGMEKVSIVTPWGQRLTTRSAGVTRLSGDGREIWRIDLDHLFRKYKREVRGIWELTASTSKKCEKTLRVDLCVFASDEGVVKLVTGLADLKPGQKGVDFRVWVGDRLEENFRAQILHRMPYNTDRKKPGIEKEVKFAVLRKKDSRWKGVHRGGVESTEAGIHEVKIVVEGSVTSQIRTNGNEFVTTDIPYRREQIVRWMVKKA